MRLFFLIFISLVLFSCNDFLLKRKQNEVKSNSVLIANQDSSLMLKGKMQEIFDADSAVFIYYKTPGNPRFFTYNKVLNMQLLNKLMNNINQSNVDSTTGCVTNGKIYFYDNTEAVYVVYFSSNDSCSTLSYIRTGEKYFIQMNSEVKKLVDSIKSYAK